MIETADAATLTAGTAALDAGLAAGVMRLVAGLADELKVTRVIAAFDGSFRLVAS